MLARTVTVKKKSKNSQPTLLIFFLAIYSLVNSFINEVSITGFARITLIAILALYFNRLNYDVTNRALRYVITAQTLMCMSVFANRIPRKNIGIDPISGLQTYPNLVGHPNYLAYMAAFNAILFLILYSRKQIWKTSGFILNLLCIIYAQSRSALIATLLSFAYIFLASIRKSYTKLNEIQPKSNFIVLVSIMVVGVYSSSLASERFIQFIQSGGFSGANSFGWRLLQWNTAIEVLKENLIFGVGWQNSQNFLLGGLKAHNSFIQVALELGLIGLALYLLIFYRFTVSLLRASNGLPFFLILMIASVVDAGLFYPSIAINLLLVTKFLCSNQPIGISSNSLTYRKNAHPKPH
jgi:O-antigen ligase